MTPNESLPEAAASSAHRPTEAVEAFDEEVGQIHIELDVVGKLNLADYQNAVPVIEGLRVVNGSDSPLSAIQLTVESVPAFLRAKTWRVDAIAAGETCVLRDLDVILDGALIAGLTEAESARLRFTLTEQVRPDEPVAVLEDRVELLPKNQWAGLSHLPDMVAAFVQPNDPTVDLLLKQTAEVLHKHGKPAGLDGYKGGPKRAWEVASAVWTAIGALGIDYTLPPASFEHTGQKVRSPSQLHQARVGTCLDLSLLFCAVLEQAGMNPIVIFTTGHAFVGLWLKAEEFSTVVVDDPSALRTRHRLNEVVFFETTLATGRPTPTFPVALAKGESQLSEQLDSAFELAVDIKRARLQRVRPLATGDDRPAPAYADPNTAAEPIFSEAPDLPDHDVPAPADPASLTPTDRLDRWQRKLLDLSLRNKLLNFRRGKRALNLLAPDAGALKDVLAEGETLRLLPRPELMDGSDPRDQGVHETRSREQLRAQHAKDALAKHHVFVDLPSDELESRLVELYRAARLTLQEGGANTLYIALGFLSWARSDKPDKKLRAPLILVPVTLARRSVRSGFTLSLHEDEPVLNPTLVEMLRQDFALDLGIPSPLPEDESGLDVDRVWQQVAQGIVDIPGWEVTEEVVLTSFSFAKYLMWKDLVDRTDELRENPVVRHLIDTPREGYTQSIDFPDPRKLDETVKPEDTFCPLSADSSQLSAVVAAARGKDFVLIGPPGTGKSQTISNLVAQCLAERKRVLFVSEKIAALEVVYRRLREVGLADFCLELHSNKARKLDVLTQLQSAWEARGELDQASWIAQAQKLGRQREALNSYVQQLHRRRRNGLSIYAAIGIVAGGTEVPSVTLRWDSPDTHSPDDRDQLGEAVAVLSLNAASIGSEALTSGPLVGIGHTDWSPGWQQELTTTAASVVSLATTVADTQQRFSAAAQLSLPEGDRSTREGVVQLAGALPLTSGRDWSFAARPDAMLTRQRLEEASELLAEHRTLSSRLSAGWPAPVREAAGHALELLVKRRSLHESLPSPWPSSLMSELREGLALLTREAELTARLSVAYSTQVEALNLPALKAQWQKAEGSIWPLSFFGKRTVRTILKGAMSSAGEANIAADLTALVERARVRNEIQSMKPGPLAQFVWQGLDTRPDIAAAALKLHETLEAARDGASWSDEGLDAVADGQCGEDLQRTLQSMQALATVDHELAQFTYLSDATAGLFVGLDTEDALLQCAVDFAADVEAHREQGMPGADYASVQRGECGPTAQADYELLSLRAAVEREIEAFSDLRELTGGSWRGLDTDPAELVRVIEFCTRLNTAVPRIAKHPQELGTIRSSLETLIRDGNALMGPDSSLAKAGTDFAACNRQLENAVTLLQARSTASLKLQEALALSTPSALAATGRGIVESASRLNAWCAWQKARQKVVSLGLRPLLDALDAGTIEHGQLDRVFQVNYHRWWLNATVDSEPVILRFVSAEHEKRIADFRSLETHFSDLTKSYIRARLSADMPGQEDVSRDTEWGTLKHEINKKRRHLPLRELINRIPSALTRLTPCLLMSPLSIAQYLSAGGQPFDIVVFDEASQIAVWDAVGAIARGKQVVMVGDPKQLPPSSFFDRSEPELDDDLLDADLESILDECIGANLPTIDLRWHYRSRSESLITFSNHRYYGGSLVTFPAPVPTDRAVTYHGVSGTYEKGGARINKPEARAVVADIVGLLKSEAFSQSGKTIGVVTFNSEQQSLIEDMLDNERRKHPDIERHFSESEIEPLFVKNLESVQGDERDIMYFSTTYGPDTSGHVSMNFGPMNRQGGERRLNVAITRARDELRVFSSLRADQIDLSRTSARGVADLKHFLDFAARGTSALAEATDGSRGGFESPFEEAVAQALQAKGWDVRTQIGVSAFRIDLAVVDPDATGSYLAGIECDGATYHRSATAKDRDMLRESVLRKLGWNILRIWSTDWWIDPVSTLAKIDSRLKELLAEMREQRAVLQLQKETAEIAAEVPELDSDLGAPEIAESDRLLYSEFDLAAAGIEADASLFEDASYDKILESMLSLVVEAEGPILDVALARRVARAHGWQRTGRRIQERVELIAQDLFESTEEDVGRFYWPKTIRKGALVPYRSAGDGVPRPIEEVCLEELANAARSMSQDHERSLPSVTELARELGLQRVGAQVRARLEATLRRAAED